MGHLKDAWGPPLALSHLEVVDLYAVQARRKQHSSVNVSIEAVHTCQPLSNGNRNMSKHEFEACSRPCQEAFAERAQ